MPKTDLRTQYEKETDDFVLTIKYGMANKKMKQKDLAKKARLSEPTVSRGLKNIDHMTFGNLRAIAKAAGVEIILRGEEL